MDEPGDNGIFEIEVTDHLDLHAFLPSEMKRATEAYLEEAVRKGFKLVRIIHGRGIGVQREMVRALLSESPHVKSFKDAPEFSGGHGATIAVLNSE